MKILLTGFVPFTGVDVNPSQLIVEKIVERGLFSELCAEALPVEYGAADERLRRLIREFEPEAVVCVGVAQSREKINLERVAINVDDADVPDNAGEVASGRMIVADAPVAYWSTLPLERMEAALKAKDIPVDISNHAGAYLCNHAFFSARHELESESRNIPCGFIHVPVLCEMPSEECKGLPLDVMVEAIETCLICLGQ